MSPDGATRWEAYSGEAFARFRFPECLTSLGRDVQIVIKEAPRRRAEGKLTVVVA